MLPMVGIKNKTTTLTFLIAVFVISSCTVLQWRESDSEIYERFFTENIPTKINYFDLDTLNLKIRSQHITTSKSKVNLVFLHGSPSSLSAWNKYLTDTTLVNKVNILAVDRPGYGYSNFGKELPEIAPQALAMSKLLDHYNLENVITIGASYGGPLAARIAALNDKVKGVIMISPAIDPNHEKDVWGSRLTQWWLTRWLVPRGYRVAGDEKTVHAQEMATIDKEWNKVTVPVMHIHGDADELVPYENTNYTKKKFSNIEIITTPKTGHEISWSRPDLILPQVYKIIDKVEKSISTNDNGTKLGGR